MPDTTETHLSNLPDERSQMIVGLMSYHPPTPEKVKRYADLRAVYIETAAAIDMLCPAGADRTAAIRQLQDSLMTANRSIANDGASYW
jgi:hypothetical protein